MRAELRNWAIVIFAPLALAFFLQMQGSEPKTVLFFGITIFIILIWALEVLPSVLAAILLPILYVVIDIAPAGKVFTPWFTFLPWVCVAGLIFSDILGRTGLANRIALICVKKVGGSFTAITVGLMLAGIILAFLVPTIMARVVIFYAVTCGFADALELKKESRMSTAILMSGFFAATSPSLIMMTGSEVNLLGINVINESEVLITWVGYLIHNLPIGLLYCLSSLLLVHLIKGKEKLPPKEQVNAMVSAKLAEMGATKPQEFKILFLLIAGVSLFVITGTQLGPWMFAIAGCLAFFPGFSLINEKQLRGLNFGFIFFVTGCMAIGTAAGHLGLPAALGAAMAPILQGESGLMCVILSYLTGVGVNFLLTPLAATGSMSGPLTAVAAELGMNPAPFIYSFLYGLEQYILPYEYLLFLYFFMDNKMTLSHTVPALAIRMVTTLLLLAGVAYPYWKMLGII